MRPWCENRIGDRAAGLVGGRKSQTRVLSVAMSRQNRRNPARNVIWAIQVTRAIKARDAFEIDFVDGVLVTVNPSMDDRV